MNIHEYIVYIPLLMEISQEIFNTYLYMYIQAEKTVHCTSSFTPNECLLLSTHLRSLNCKIQHLILQNIEGRNPSFEFDLLPAIQACRALKSIKIEGGIYTKSFLINLIFTVQVENPRIQSVFIEGQGGESYWGMGQGYVTEDLSLAVGRLVC
jgi:hypothetical protein